MKISWTSSVKIAVKADGSYAIKQRKGFELGVDTLISAVTSLAANSPQIFATALQEVDDSGTKYTTYGLAQCTCIKKLLVPYAFPGFMGGRKALLWWARALRLHLWRSTTATSGIYLQSTKTTHVEKEDYFDSGGRRSECSSHPSTPYPFLFLEEAEEEIW